MQIKDLQIRQGNIDLVADVTEKGDIRTFEKFGRQGKVCNVVVKDESGEIKLSLFNDDVDKVHVGDKVHVQNGWVSEWQGEKQLSAGKFGKLVVVGKASELPKEKPKEEPKKQGETDADEFDEDLDVDEEDIEM